MSLGMLRKECSKKCLYLCLKQYIVLFKLYSVFKISTNFKLNSTKGIYTVTRVQSILKARLVSKNMSENIPKMEDFQ